MINHCTVTFLFLFLCHIGSQRWSELFNNMFMNIYSVDKLCQFLMSLIYIYIYAIILLYILRSFHSLKIKILAVRLSCKNPLLKVKTMYLHFCMEMVHRQHLFISYLITTRLLHSRACATVARKWRPFVAFFLKNSYYAPMHTDIRRLLPVANIFVIICFFSCLFSSPVVWKNPCWDVRATLLYLNRCRPNFFQVRTHCRKASQS